MSKQFLAILAVVIAVFVGIIVFNNNEAEAPPTANQETTEHTQGDESAPVTLVEYADFQCPACINYYPILKQLKTKYGDQLRFQFRHFPLVSIHPNAMAAHRAAEAAGKQDKFWQMHDLLYENAREWTTSNNPTIIFEGYANRLDLDMDRYRSDLASTAVKDVIDADMQAGQQANVTSTPTFILNGEKIDSNPQDLEGFSALIDPLLEQSGDASGDTAGEEATGE